MKRIITLLVTLSLLAAFAVSTVAYSADEAPAPTTNSTKKPKKNDLDS